MALAEVRVYGVVRSARSLSIASTGIAKVAVSPVVILNTSNTVCVHVKSFDAGSTLGRLVVVTVTIASSITSTTSSVLACVAIAEFLAVGSEVVCLANAYVIYVASSVSVAFENVCTTNLSTHGICGIIAELVLESSHDGQVSSACGRTTESHRGARVELHVNHCYQAPRVNCCSHYSRVRN